MNEESSSDYSNLQPSDSMPKTRDPQTLSSFKVKKGYTWILWAIFAGVLYGFVPVLLGKSSVFGFYT